MCIAAARYIVVDLVVDSLEEDIEAGFGNSYCCIVDCFACCRLVVVGRLCCWLDRSRRRLLRRGPVGCMPLLILGINTATYQYCQCNDAILSRQQLDVVLRIAVEER